MKTQIALLTTAALLAGCSSVSKVIPSKTKVVEVHQPVTTVQNASYKTNASPEQAAIVCDTADMRARVVDYDNSNDIVRIMVVQDNHGGSSLLSEVEIDCRDYHLRKSLADSRSNIIRTSTDSSAPARVIRSNVQIEDTSYTYIVQRGDTVWQIAREHCTTVNAISRLNGLGSGKLIGINQRLKMPNDGC